MKWLSLVTGLALAWAQAERRWIATFHNAADPYLFQLAIHPLIYPSPDAVNIFFRLAAPPGPVDGPSGSFVDVHWERQGQLISTMPFRLPPANTRNIAIIRGVYQPSAFAPNPQGRNTDFSLTLIELPSSPPAANKFAIIPYHGVTDLSATDFLLDGTPIGGGIGYTDFPILGFYPRGSFTEIDANTSHTLTLRLSFTQQVLGEFSIDPNQVPGGIEGVVLTSGFLNPAQNQNGPGWGVFLVHYATAQVYQLTQISTSLTSKGGQEVVVFASPGSTEWVARVTGAAQGRIAYQIYDVAGREMQRGEWEVPSTSTWFFRIDVGQLTPGAYYLRVLDKVFRVMR